MAQPLPPEAKLPEAPDARSSPGRTRTAWTATARTDSSDGRPYIRLLQDPPERKATGPRPRPGVRKRTSRERRSAAAPRPWA